MTSLEITKLPKEIGKDLTGLFSISPNYARINGFVLPEFFIKDVEAIANFKVRDDDVWICSFPKTGTTWTQEIVWCLGNDLDYEGAKVNLSKRFPLIDISGIISTGGTLDDIQSMKDMEYFISPREYAEKIESPRFIKTHLPFHLLPYELQNPECKAKIININRNPKDTCISYYHHHSRLPGFKGNFETFSKLFLENAVSYAPFDKHILSYWNRREQNNILLLRYEDMQKDLFSEIQKIANFLGKEIDEEQCTELVNFVSFGVMKKRREENLGDAGVEMWKGKVGSWQEEMDEETVKNFQEWENLHFSDSDLTFIDCIGSSTIY